MDQQSILDSLKTQSPEAWLAYLRRYEDRVDTGLSMQVIFDYAVRLAKEHESLEWAEVAVRAAELAASQDCGVEREQDLQRAMRLRTWFISRMGSRTGHAVLDKAAVLHWAMDSLTLPIPTAREMAASFWADFAEAQTSPDPEDLRRMAKRLHQLRWLRHRLDVVKMLADSGELPSDSVFHEWLQLREALP